MLNSDKARLRRIMREYPDRYTDEEAAEQCDCTPGTARKYRKVFAK